MFLSQLLDDRTRHDRIENTTAHWDLQISFLVNVYLGSLNRDRGDGMPAPLDPSRHHGESIMDVYRKC